ncbi:MAG: L-2-amino-thiazoline-4-carboxylic acid hydrolase, partial [Clostridiales bacterium]|nr:L-2-amino-thiazoline-4-carboxylic acid hydrolase [Clostridiales bacterium]
MKYIGMPMGMWALFKISFKKNLVSVLGLSEEEALNAADRNPYSWNMEFLPYEDGSGYEARFSKCGICTLMKELGLYDLVPAMCH